MSAELSLAEARRLAVTSQALGGPRPTGRIGRRHLARVLDTVGPIQIDSVNVLVRSQELPLFSRLGPHRRDLIPEATAEGEMFEYWCHAASHLPSSMLPLVRYRMERARRGELWEGVAETARNNRALVTAIRRRIAAEGSLVAGDVRTRTGPKGTWWDWDEGKAVLEWMFATGEITAQRRPADFARVYRTWETALPADVLALPTPTEDEARSELLVRAARALGVATAKDLFDYHRQRAREAAPLLAALVEEGRLVRTTVEGWSDPAFMPARTRIPGATSARALLSPFDSLVWCRDRVERLFDFRYRIEIYTPAARRVHGYYVLPFLLGDRLVGRVDLKADRPRGVLSVPGAFTEARVRATEVADALADELVDMARWLGLDAIEVGAKGDLSRSLRRAVAARAPI